MLASPFFREACSLGLYITCQRLREVDTMLLLQHALQSAGELEAGCVCVCGGGQEPGAGRQADRLSGMQNGIDGTCGPPERIFHHFLCVPRPGCLPMCQADKRVFVPLVEDSASNMSMLHIGRLCSFNWGATGVPQ